MYRGTQSTQILRLLLYRIVSESLESDGIRINLDWTHEDQSQYSYNVSVSPTALLSQTHSEGEIQFIASYDTLYNISLLAIPQCGQKVVTTLIELHYGKCNHNVTVIVNLPVSVVLNYFSFSGLPKSSRTAP